MRRGKALVDQMSSLRQADADQLSMTPRDIAGREGAVDDREDDDIEVDTCLGCGRAFDSSTAEIVDGHVVQLCHRCKRGDTPPHEY